MMASLLKYLHILLFVAWLGIDVGVFSSSFIVRRRGISNETRIVLRRLMRALDLAPRLSLILMIPVAISLAYTTGKGLDGAPQWVFPLLAGFALLWVLASLWVFKRLGLMSKETDPRVRARVKIVGNIDLAMRAIFSAIFIVFGLASLFGSGPWNAQPIAWKSTLFGIVILCGIWIRIGGKDFGPALALVLNDNAGEPALIRMDRAMYRVYPAIIWIWISLLVMAAIPIFT